MQKHGLPIILGITIFYIVITALIGLRSKKYTRDAENFMDGGRNIGTLMAASLLISEFIGTGSTMGTAELAFDKGISAAWNLITMFFAFILFAFFMAPKYQKIGEYTISGVLAREYGDGVRLLTSLIMISSLMMINITLYVGGTSAIVSLLNIPANIAVYIIAVITILYVSAGGLRGVAHIAVCHSIVKFLGIVFVISTALRMSGGLKNLQTIMPPLYFSWDGVGVSTIFAWTIGNIGAVFSTQYVIQAINAVSSETEAKRTSILVGILIAPIGIMSAIIGIAAKALFPSIKGIMAVPLFATLMNPWMGGIVIAGLVAAVFGTVSACTLGATALIMKDIYIPLVNPNDPHQLIASRFISVVVGFLPIPFALLMPEILKVVFFSRALRTVIAIVVIGTFYFPSFCTNGGVLWSLVLATVGTTIWYSLGNPFGIDNMYVAVALTLITMGFAHLLFLRKGNIAKNKASC